MRLVITLPNGRAVGLRQYVSAWRTLKTLPAEQRVTGFEEFPTTAECVLREFERGLHERITARGCTQLRVPARRLSSAFQNALMRDANRLRAIARRVRVYQFETDIVRRRCAHLLASRAD